MSEQIKSFLFFLILLLVLYVLTQKFIISNWIFSFLLASNITSYVAYFSDKVKARRGKYRIPERTLLILTIFGLFGVDLARKIHHHKISKSTFKDSILLIRVFYVLAIGFVIYLQCSNS